MLRDYLIQARNVEPEAAAAMAEALARGETVAMPHEGHGRAYDLMEFLQNYGGRPYNNEDRARMVREARKLWRAQGYVGLRYVNTSPMETAEASDLAAYVVFPDEQGAMPIRTYQATGVDEQGGEIVRGATEFAEVNGRIVSATVRLTEAANFSTFLHESGHIFLEIIREFGTRANATEASKDLWLRTAAWLEIEPGEAFEVAHHELFARTFEAYLRNGQAPNISLTRAFALFQKWLTRLYERIKLDHKLNPEITYVFDRLFASEAEILRAREASGATVPLFADLQTAQSLGLTDAEFASYRQKVDDARNDAEASLTAVAMDAYFRQQTAWWNRQLGKARREAMREVDTSPARRAFDWLAYQQYRGDIKKPKKSNGEDVDPDWGFVPPPAGLAPMEINFQAVLDTYDDGGLMLDELPPELRQVSEADVDALYRQAREARKANVQRNAPRRLASFLVQRGGIRDPGGDVLSILGSHRARPGLINNSSGMSLDDAALFAWEAGYFGAKPTKGNYGDGPTYYQTAPEVQVRTDARLENIRITPATPGELVKLGQAVSVKIGDPDADFYIVRRGSAKTVGSVTREYNPEHFGVRVTATDAIDPSYLYYAMMHRHQTGVYEAIATGTLKLVNIKKADITGLVIGQTPATDASRSADVIDGAKLDARPPLQVARIYYSSDSVDRPTTRQFLDALADDLRGEPVYKVEDLEDVWASDAQREAGYWFGARGIDINAPAAELRKQITNWVKAQSQAGNPNALHPDEIAQAFGIKDGAELLRMLAALGPRRKLVERLAAKKVRELYGDPFQDGTMETAAQEAAHRAKHSRVLELELEIVSRATSGNAKAIAKAARKLAQERVQRMTVRQLSTFNRVLGQERKHGKAAAAAMRAGDLATASLEKNAQLIAFHLWAEMRDAHAEVEKMQRLFQSFNSRNVRQHIDPGHLTQIDALLEQFELRRISLREEARRDALVSYVRMMEKRGLDNLLAIDERLIERAQRRPFSRLTFDEAEGLYDTIRNLRHLGQLKQGLLIKRERQRIADVESEIVASIHANGLEHVDAKNRLRLEEDNQVEESKASLERLHAENVKMEFMFRLLDGLKDNGPVWRHLFRPIAEAEAAELEMQRLAAERTQQLFAAFTAKEREEMFSKKSMFTEIGERLTRAQVIAIALNSGNEYSRRVMLEGYGWTETQLQGILDRMDVRDLRLVQGIWDWLEEYREPSFSLHERLTGVRPRAVEAKSFTAAGQVWKGGYYPVKYNPSKTEKTHDRQQVETTQETHPNMIRAQTRKGMLVERTGAGDQLIRLDLSVLQEHVQEVIHFVAFEEAILDAGRLIERPAIQAAIIGAVGRNLFRQIKPWLKDIAAKPKTPHGFLENLLTNLSNNVSVVAMGWKVSTAIVQPLGILGAIPRIGAGPIWRQVSRLYWRPDRLAAAFQFVVSRSSAMRHRIDTYDRDVRDAMVTVAGRAKGDPIPANIRRTFFWATATMDMGVSIPIWLAAYNEAMAGRVANISTTDPRVEDAAIQYADSIVRMTQGSGSLKDTSALMRQRGAMRLFTKFMTYFSTLYNQFYVEQIPGLAGGKISPAQFAINMMALWFLPVVLAEILQGRVGDEPPEDELANLAKQTLAYPLMTVPGVRDVMSGIISPYGYELSPAGAIGEAVTGVGQDIVTGDLGDGTVKHAFMSAGYLIGFPARQLYITGDYAIDIVEGQENPVRDPGSIYSEGLLRDTR
jgi:hypothetical protein